MTAPATPASPDRRVAWLLGAGCAALATVLLARATVPSIWYDELFSRRMAREPLGDWIDILGRGEANGALHHLVLRAVVPVLGDDLLALRLPSIAAWVAGVPLLWALLRRVAPPVPAALAAGVYGLAPLGLTHALDARTYAVTATATIAATLALVRFVERPTRGRALADGVVTALALACHFMVIPVVAAHAIALLLHPDRGRLLRRGWPAAAVVVAALVPMALVAERNRTRQISWIPSLSVGDTLETLAVLLGLTRERAVALDVALAMPALALLLAGLWVAIRTGAVAGREEPDTRWLARLLALWAGLPVAAVLTMTALGRPMVVDRYLIVSLPAVVGLAVVGARAVATIAGARSTAIAAGVATLAVAATLPSVATALSADHYEEDWRAAGALLTDRLQPGDVVLTADSSDGELGADGLLFHLEGDRRAAVTDALLSLDPDTWPSAPPRVWVVTRGDPSEGAEQATRTLAALGADPAPVEQWPDSGVRVALHLAADAEAPGR